MSTLTVVFPAHNEEHRIGATLDAYTTHLIDPSIEFVVAMDDCKDGTERVVAQRAQQDPRIGSRCFPKLGKGGVLMEAFRSVDGDVVAFVDADGATPPAELMRLVDVVTGSGADGAIASRWHPSAVIPHARLRPFSRRIASRGFAAAVRRFFGLRYRDTQCGAKVFRRSALHGMLPLLSSRDFLFDVDVLLTARALRLDLREVPTIWLDQAESRVRIGRDSRRMAASMLRLWLHHRVMPISAPAASTVAQRDAAHAASAQAASAHAASSAEQDDREAGLRVA